ncbi:uncharacterized protein LOC115884684 [Sitophilus oryzae]|uniref:Uncharacterized protein LOC115884684 n=1 Tax=Sitophilus oryzae TaxID=7048 RepID=A0A6J2Y5T6_SITOR|nr:uncharacterized protein LOC115884684 [Sitophilus oryzae]
MKTEIYFSSSFVILLVTFSFALSQTIQCYDCDPVDEGEKCGDPATSVPKLLNCNKEFGPPESNSTYICLSAYIKYSSNDTLTGVYRGCKSQKSDVESYCDFFKEEIDGPNATVISCTTCTDSLCNNQTFSLSGNLNDAVSLQYVVFPLVLSLVFLLVA